MIASLPMYWRAENAEAWRTFWDLVRRAHGPGLPDLSAPETLAAPWTAHWRSPDLALSMTCGLPFRTALKGRVTYVGTFGFGLNCAAGYYYSRVLRRADMAPGAALNRLAYNAPDSQSGWAAVHDRHSGNPRCELTSYLETGSHAASLAAVAEGRADVTWIDAVTWRLLKRFDANARRVVLAGQSSRTPGLPLITAPGRDPTALRGALLAAVTDLPDALRADLGGLNGFAVLDEARYHAQPVPPPPPA